MADIPGGYNMNSYPAFMDDGTGTGNMVYTFGTFNSGDTGMFKLYRHNNFVRIFHFIQPNLTDVFMFL